MNLKNVAFVAGLLASTSAFAADLPARTNAAAPAFAAPATWSGAYVGLVAGAGLLSSTLDDKNCNLSCSSLSLSNAGVSGGLTLGYNFQVGRNTVLGLEADYAMTSFKKTLVDVDWGTDGTRHSVQWNAVATLRARAGLAVDQTLIYATAGLALVDQKATGAYNANGDCNGVCFKQDGYRTGFAGGVGVEYALGRNLSLKGEYLYISLPGKQSQDLVRTNAYDMYGVKSDAQQGRLGVNYRF